MNSSKREEKKLQALYDKRFEAKRELQKLVAELEKNYLAYFQLKYENKIVSVTGASIEITGQPNRHN